MKKPYIILIRGLPGSGKSTLAKALTLIFDDLEHIENDMFRIDEEGYAYSDDDYYDVRKKAMQVAEHLLENNKSIVVSNVFTKSSSMDQYTRLGYPYVIIQTTGNYGSINSVPDSAIDNIRQNFLGVKGEYVLGDTNNISIAEMRKLIETAIGDHYEKQ